MKYCLVLLLLPLLLFAQPPVAQPPITLPELQIKRELPVVHAPDIWLLTLGANGDSLASRVWAGDSCGSVLDAASAPDGGYAVLLVAPSVERGKGAVLRLVRFAPGGDSLWSRALPLDSGEHITSVHGPLLTAARDGGWLMALRVEATGLPAQSVRVLRADAAGAVRWSRTHVMHEAVTEIANVAGIRELPDHSILLAGTIRVRIDTTAKIPDSLRVMRLDAEGNKVASRSYTLLSSSLRSTVAISEDGYILVAGGNCPDNRGPRGREVHRPKLPCGLWVMGIAPDGSMDWSQTVQEAYNLMCRDALFLPKGFAVAARSQTCDSCDLQPFVMSLKTNGNVRWIRNLPLVGGFQALLSSAKGTLLAAGRQSRERRESCLAARLSAKGKLVWTRNFQRNGNDACEHLVELPGGNLVLIGPSTARQIRVTGTN